MITSSIRFKAFRVTSFVRELKKDQALAVMNLQRQILITRRVVIAII